jgi:Outer membrane protein
MRKSFAFLVGCVLSVSVHAQFAFDSLFVLPKDVEPFTLENLYAAVLEYHPIVKQTRLLGETAQQEIRLARGAFDPKAETRFITKEFEDKTYYRKWNASISFPTWFPVDPKIGIENNTGAYLNPEDGLSNADNNRQLFTGVSIPLGQGLFTDERRASLKQAKLFVQMTEAEQVKLINKILLEASKDYWQWYHAFYNYQLLSRNAQIAADIFKRVKLNATLGEASAMDSIQAKITWQQRVVERQESYLEFINGGIKISNYLWDKDGNPLQLPEKVAPVLENGYPQILSSETLEELTTQARVNHPELKKLSVKLDQLEVERRLAFEYLKPRLDINYNFLNQPLSPQGEFQSFAFTNNYKFGLDFSMPILIRKERAKLAQSKIKIQSTQFERTQAEREIINQLNSVYNQLQNTVIILQQQTDIARNYERLLSAELFNLENGESDLFKINVQQEKLIQSQAKLLKLQSEYEKMKALLYWAAGVAQLNYSVN